MKYKNNIQLKSHKTSQEKNYFDGFYFKHQKEDNMLAFIPGISDDRAFIQVIDNNSSYCFFYPLKEDVNENGIKIGNCKFSDEGIIINIQKDNVSIVGKIMYTNLTPLRYDIMGPFRYFPMECRHGIISLHHHLKGKITINGRNIDFSDGIGYIEKDSGTSFPKSYLWLQCNDFKEKCSISVSVADIPFAGFHFKGCICVVYYQNKEYRLATYLGVKIIRCDNKKIILRQGKYHLTISVSPCEGQKLLAPDKGKMNRRISESMDCKARFRFYENGKLLFDFKSGRAGFECVE